jgi:hypothetical protein
MKMKNNKNEKKQNQNKKNGNEKGREGMECTKQQQSRNNTSQHIDEQMRRNEQTHKMDKNTNK